MAADRGKYIDQSQSLTLDSRVQEWGVGVDDFSHELLEIWYYKFLGSRISYHFRFDFDLCWQDFDLIHVSGLMLKQPPRHTKCHICSSWFDLCRELLPAWVGIDLQDLHEMPWHLHDMVQSNLHRWHFSIIVVSRFVSTKNEHGHVCHVGKTLRNIHMTDATTAKLTSMHFHGWERGLKTGMCHAWMLKGGSCLGKSFEMVMMTQT